MPSKTRFYQLERLDAGDPFSSDNQQFTLSDRDEIDRVLYQGAQGHHHTGAAAGVADPTQPATLALDTTSGNLPGNVTVYYAFTWVDPNGFETAPSPVVSQSLPGQVTTPASPTLTPAVGTGTLAAGAYEYVVSAYTGSITTSETPAGPSASVALSATGQIVLTFPTQPVGTAGWNIYRQKPGGSVFYYVTSVASTLGSVPSWTDDGSLADICSRLSPTQNTTSSTNTITATLPTAIPAGFTWRLYRTAVQGVWISSLLANVVSGATSYVDTGVSSSSGSPPSNSQLIDQPSQVNLASEVTGILPTSKLSAPLFVEFDYPGFVTPESGTGVWVCPFASATILDTTCTLGRGSAPASQNVQVDVLKGNGAATPTYASIYAAATPVYPYIPVGQQVGPACPPVVTSLVRGDTLTTSVLQAGGGATPTDHDLTMIVRLWVEDN